MKTQMFKFNHSILLIFSNSLKTQLFFYPLSTPILIIKIKIHKSVSTLRNDDDDDNITKKSDPIIKIATDDIVKIPKIKGLPADPINPTSGNLHRNPINEFLSKLTKLSFHTKNDKNNLLFSDFNQENKKSPNLFLDSPDLNLKHLNSSADKLLLKFDNNYTELARFNFKTDGYGEDSLKNYNLGLELLKKFKLSEEKFNIKLGFSTQLKEIEDISKLEIEAIIQYDKSDDQSISTENNTTKIQSSRHPTPETTTTNEIARSRTIPGPREVSNKNPNPLIDFPKNKPGRWWWGGDDDDID